MITTFTPRDYQSEAAEKIVDCLRENRSALAVLPTGCGKTVIFSMVASNWPGRVLVLAHREELVFQAASKLEEMFDELVGIEMALESCASTHGDLHRIVCSTVQTMSRRNRMAMYDPFKFGLIITDEAHHAVSDSYKAVYDYFFRNPEIRHLGVTATPNRHDEKALGSVFETCPVNIGIREMIDEGWLVDINQYMVKVEALDISEVKTVGGDLNQGQLQDVLEDDDVAYGMVDAAVGLIEERKAIFFTAGVRQAMLVANLINHKAGRECAAWLSGESSEDERRGTLDAYREGRINILVNCALFTEGFDSPDTEVIVMGRPTKSLPLYCQMLGRGTRPLPGVVDGIESPEDRKKAIAESAKPSMDVLDFVGNSGRHKIVSSVDALGGDMEDEVLEKAKKKIIQKGSGKTSEELQLAEEEISLFIRQSAGKKAVYNVSNISPFDLLQVNVGRSPEWNKGRRLTPGQVGALRRFGIDDKHIFDMDFHSAGKMLDRLISRSKKGLCTFKQARLLKKYGFSPNVTFAEASKIIGEMAKNWRKHK